MLKNRSVSFTLNSHQMSRHIVRPEYLNRPWEPYPLIGDRGKRMDWNKKSNIRSYSCVVELYGQY